MLYGIGAVAASLPESLHKSRLRFYKSKSSFHKSGIRFHKSGTCFYKSPSCETKSGSCPCKLRISDGKQNFVKLCRRFVKANRRDVRSTSRLPHDGLARIYLYVHSVRKKHSPVHQRLFFPLISISFECEGLRRKAFTPPVSCCEHFTPLPFTPEKTENQRETSIL